MVTDYEITYIIRPQLEEAEVDERIGKIAEIVRTTGGEVVGEVEKLGKKRLAYEIADVREGYYATMRFKSEPEQADELTRQLKLSEDVLRHLVIRQDEK